MSSLPAFKLKEAFPMAHLNKTCLCCREKYSHCPNCSRVDALKPSWANEFCSEPCMALWTTLTRFGMNRITKTEAKSIISKLDLKPIDTYAACVQRDYAKVMVEDKKPKRGKRIEINPMNDAIDIPKEVVESVAEELMGKIKIEQPIEVAEVAEPTVHEGVIEKENE